MTSIFPQSSVQYIHTYKETNFIIEKINDDKYKPFIDGLYKYNEGISALHNIYYIYKHYLGSKNINFWLCYVADIKNNIQSRNIEMVFMVLIIFINS